MTTAQILLLEGVVGAPPSGGFAIGIPTFQYSSEVGTLQAASEVAQEVLPKLLPSISIDLVRLDDDIAVAAVVMLAPEAGLKG